jgi:hypothetical protein
MSDLTPLLAEALAAIGRETQARIDDLIEDFATLPLSAEARLSALAGAVATIATMRYCQHRPIFIAALRGWALELAMGGARPQAMVEERGRVRVARAQSRLLEAIDTLLRAMDARGARKHHRLVTELAVMARLLARCEAQGLHLVLTAASRACDDPAWCSGDAVPVSLDEAALPLTRDAPIATLAPRGTA